MPPRSAAVQHAIRLLRTAELEQEYADAWEDWESSGDRANTTAARLGRGIGTVVPVTSNVRRVHSFQVLLPADRSGLRADSRAQAEQVRSISVDRLGLALARLPAPLMGDIDEALRLHLDLEVTRPGR